MNGGEITFVENFPEQEEDNIHHAEKMHGNTCPDNVLRDVKNNKVKKRILPSVREKKEVTSKGMTCRHTTDFPTAIMEARGGGIMLRGKKKLLSTCNCTNRNVIFPIEGEIKAFS